MEKIIGIRRESIEPTEGRAPLSPLQVQRIIENNNIKILIQPSPQRKFTDDEYVDCGAIIAEDLSSCDIILGVKEVPVEELISDKIYIFFSHTIKGQDYNMPRLRKILEKNITLIDYELVKNEFGKRIIFFGEFAGYVGMINSLWIMGQRLLHEGIANPFRVIKQANNYESLDKAKKAVIKAGERISSIGLSYDLVPFIVGFTGYGRVSKGAQEIFDLLPVVEIRPEDLSDFIKEGKFSNKVVYKCEFRKLDLYEHSPKTDLFDLNELELHPDEYQTAFEKFVPFLSILINGIYWEPRFPKLVTKEFMKSLSAATDNPKLKVIGDITCDIEGSIELTVKAANSLNPCFTYNPINNRVTDGWKGKGVTIMSVDKLPAELPRQATESFGKALSPFIPALAKADLSKPAADLKLPREFRNAVIAHQGKLTPQFEYLYEFLESTDK